MMCVILAHEHGSMCLHFAPCMHGRFAARCNVQSTDTPTSQVCCVSCCVQASMPMVVFVVGVLFGTEKFTFATGINMVVVGTGIAIASYGAWHQAEMT